MKRLFQCGALVIFMAAATVGAAAQCKLEVSTPKPILPEDVKQTVCIKIGVTGFEMESQGTRKPLNIAIVLDRSGSMSGEKIKQAKEAAQAAVELMKPDDIVAVIAYDSEVEIIVPATKLGDKKSVLEKIEKIESGGTTALYEGTEKGGVEVKKFLDKEKINRVILLSDGLANVGPSTPAEAGKLGQKLGGDRICVTTLGLGDGYNEDLMVQLSQASDGNHVYITKASNLVEVFDEEFQSATKVVAQEVSCRLICEEDIRPIRILNRDGKIDGQNVTFSWNQIYASHERYVLVEVEVPATAAGESKKLATAQLSYANMETNATDELSASVSVKFSADKEEIEKAIDKKALEAYTLQTANLDNIEATRLRDTGDIKGAQKLLESNASRLREAADFLDSALLDEAAAMNDSQATTVTDEASWGNERKKMRANQNSYGGQQMSAPVK